MAVNKPFTRNARIFVDNSFTEGGRARHIKHKKYALSPEHYIRAYNLLQKDLLELFDYIEPAAKNLNTYSFSIHELLLRTCIEIEANCRAILKENIFSKNERDWNILDYKKINATHRLSSYEIIFPVWNGSSYKRKPFINWAYSAPLIRYQAYNKTKHNRHSEFENATFECLIDAVSGLIVLLISQFLAEDFSPTDDLLSIGNSFDDDSESAIGGYFRIKYAVDWEESRKISV